MAGSEQILSEFGGREPMRTRRIIRLALGRGLIRTEGSTPAATTDAVILQEIRPRDTRGGVVALCPAQTSVGWVRRMLGSPHGCRAVSPP